MLIYMLEHLFFNIKYGFLFRKRIYEFMPLIALSSIFFANLKFKVNLFLLFTTLFATTIVILPTFGFVSIKSIYVSHNLDSCISDDAEISFNLSNNKTQKFIYLYRPTTEYRWFGWSTNETYWGIPYEPPSFENQVDVCGIMLSKDDIVCDDDEINKIEEDCMKKLTSPPDIVKNTLIFTANKLCSTYLPESNRLCRYYN